MGKDASEKKVKDKKEKKEKKEKHSEDGVKKSKKEKKSKVNGDVEMTDALEAELEKEPEQSMVKIVNGEDGGLKEVPKSALVPFAAPLSEDAKEVKKILRTVKKSAKSKTLRRGVKEVVKYLRKATTNAPPSSGVTDPPAVVVLAADISPMDVISHIPVLCEDHNIPYIFVKSRVELGEASATKRPTSVVLVGKERGGKKGKVEEEDWDEAWDNLRGIVVKASKTVKK